MDNMNDTLHRTDTLNPNKAVVCGKQIQHWIELQLLDEYGDPLANSPYPAVNDATRADCAPEYVGLSDAEGGFASTGCTRYRSHCVLEATPLAELRFFLPSTAPSN
jgi:hypothetical protein